VEWTIPAFNPQPQSVAALWLVLIPGPLMVGGWVGWVAWWNAEVVCPPEDGHPSHYLSRQPRITRDVESRVQYALTTRLPSYPCMNERCCVTAERRRWNCQLDASRSITVQRSIYCTTTPHMRCTTCITATTAPPHQGSVSISYYLTRHVVSLYTAALPCFPTSVVIYKRVCLVYAASSMSYILLRQLSDCL